MASGLLKDYIGTGPVAGRPASPDLADDTAGFWWDPATGLSAWDGSAWDDVSGGGGSWPVRGVNTQTTGYTLVLADAEDIVVMNSASGLNLTVPTNASVAFPVGTEIPVYSIGAGQLTIVASGGVTVNSPETLKLRTQHSAATLVKIGTNTWQLVGDLELV